MPGVEVPLAVFLGLTVVIMGGAAFLTGHAMASKWRSMWLTAFYTLLLGLGDRFLVYALFDGPLLSLSGYVVHTAVLMAISLTAYRMTRARKMVQQYPWLYERVGLFGWRERQRPLET